MKQNSLLIICFFALLAAYCHHVTLYTVSLSARFPSFWLKTTHEAITSYYVVSMIYSLFIFFMMSASLMFGKYTSDEESNIFFEIIKIIVVIASLFCLNNFNLPIAVFIILAHVL